MAGKWRIHTGRFVLFAARNNVFNACRNDRASNGSHRFKWSAHRRWRRLQLATSRDDAANGGRTRGQAVRHWWSLLHWQWRNDCLRRFVKLQVWPDNALWGDLVHSTLSDWWSRCYVEKLSYALIWFLNKIKLFYMFKFQFQKIPQINFVRPFPHFSHVDCAADVVIAWLNFWHKVDQGFVFIFLPAILPGFWSSFVMIAFSSSCWAENTCFCKMLTWTQFAQWYRLNLLFLTLFTGKISSSISSSIFNQ